MKLPKKKLIYRIVFIIVTLAVVVFITFNEYGFLKYLHVKRELKQLNEEILRSEERIKAMEAEIDSLKTSKEKIEQVAREKYDMKKKNEKVFKIEEK